MGFSVLRHAVCLTASGGLRLLLVAAFFVASSVASFEGVAADKERILSEFDDPAAWEPDRWARTSRLIDNVFETSALSIVEALLDLHGPRILAEPKWRERVLNSPEFFAILLSRLSLLDSLDPDVREAFLVKVRYHSPQILGLFESLSGAATSIEFLRRVPFDMNEKPAWVHAGVRSALERFLSLDPTTDEILWLALAMRSEEEYFYIKRRALNRTRDASRFLQLTEPNLRLPSGVSLKRAQEFLIEHIGIFFRLRPTAAQMNQFRLRVGSASVDLQVLIWALQSANDAGEIARLVSHQPPFLYSTRELDLRRRFLVSMVDRFARLEPDAQEINAYRKAMHSASADFKLMELMLPKLTRARDIVAMMALHFRSDDRSPYGLELKKFAVANLDFFLLRNPTTLEMNSYRRLLGRENDFRLLPRALEEAQSPVEMVRTATLFGPEPAVRPGAYDSMMMKLLAGQTDRFLGLRPTLPQIEAYRTRLANPVLDLKLVEYGLMIATTQAEATALVARVPIRTTCTYDRERARIMSIHGHRFGLYPPRPSPLCP